MFCCCNHSASRFDVLSVERCYFSKSGYLSNWFFYISLNQFWPFFIIYIWLKVNEFSLFKIFAYSSVRFGQLFFLFLSRVWTQTVFSLTIIKAYLWVNKVMSVGMYCVSVVVFECRIYTRLSVSYCILFILKYRAFTLQIVASVFLLDFVCFYETYLVYIEWNIIYTGLFVFMAKDSHIYSLFFYIL